MLLGAAIVSAMRLPNQTSSADNDYMTNRDEMSHCTHENRLILSSPKTELTTYLFLCRRALDLSSPLQWSRTTLNPVRLITSWARALVALLPIERRYGQNNGNAWEEPLETIGAASTVFFGTVCRQQGELKDDHARKLNRI